MSDGFDDEFREILIRVDERTERIDNRLQSLEEDVEFVERHTAKELAGFREEISEIDHRVRRNTLILSAITFGLSTLVGAVATKISTVLQILR
jgi:archaellum component FlaC